jgi:hypothetical protein
MTSMHKPTNPLLRVVSLAKTGPRAIIKRYIDQGYRKITGAPYWKYSEVTSQLYVGGQQYPKGYQEMLDRGITGIVNMREDYHSDVEKGVEGPNHLHLITRDNTPPKLEDLHRGAEFIRDEINNGGKVYVHCGVGVGRAPTMAAAYLVTTGLSAEEALSAIRKVRPFIHLTDTQTAILHEFVQHWQNNKSTD